MSYQIMESIMKFAERKANCAKGVVGFIMTVTSPYLDFLGTVTQVLGGIGGLVLLGLAISHKRLQNKHEQMKIDYFIKHNKPSED